MSIPAAKDIKPKVKGQSDFFSWNLYRWMKERGDYYNRVFVRNWCHLHGEDSKKTELMIGRIGKDGWFSGREIIRVMIGGDGLTPYAYIPTKRSPSQWVEITDSFWLQYMRVGRCAVGIHDWQESEIGRRCLRCEAYQRKQVRIETRERVYFEGEA